MLTSNFNRIKFALHYVLTNNIYWSKLSCLTMRLLINSIWLFNIVFWLTLFTWDRYSKLSMRLLTPSLLVQRDKELLYLIKLYNQHSTKTPVTTMLTYPWKCTVLHCNHLGNTWKPLLLMTRHFDYCPSASEGDNQSVRSSAPVVSRCFPGGYNVKLYISRGRLASWLLAFFTQCCNRLTLFNARISCLMLHPMGKLQRLFIKHNAQVTFQGISLIFKNLCSNALTFYKLTRKSLLIRVGQSCVMITFMFPICTKSECIPPGSEAGEVRTSIAYNMHYIILGKCKLHYFR